MRELFVWYRVRGSDAEAARAAVTAMQAALSTTVDGLVARLLVRHDGSTSSQTWMETYARPGHGDGIDADLEARIESAAAALAGLIDGARHGEAFAPIAAPAQSTRSIST